MVRPKGTGANARDRLVAAAGRGFRKGGFGGIGVDALAKEAGLTSGAFYAHLGSKAGAFRIAVDDGLTYLLNGIQDFQMQYGEDWRDRFVDFYLGDRMATDLDEACALPTLTADVVRADDETRQSYTKGVTEIVDRIANGPGQPLSRDQAWTFLAILTGAAGTARALQDTKLREEILFAAARAAKAIQAFNPDRARD